MKDTEQDYHTQKACKENQIARILVTKPSLKWLYQRISYEVQKGNKADSTSFSKEVHVIAMRM